MTDAALERVAERLREEGGLLADALTCGPSPPSVPDGDPGLGALAAAGPRAAGHAERIAAVVEAVHEGHLLHLGRSRILDASDLDLALLAGDRLYALGLAGLAEIGDVDAVRELADVIALCAQARAEGSPDLASAVWEAGAVAVGWGSTAELQAAKAAARAGDAGAPEALRAAARRLSGVPAPVR